MRSLPVCGWGAEVARIPLIAKSAMNGAPGERGSGAVAGALEDAQVGAPWADGGAVLVGEDAGDLVKVG